MKRYVCVHEMDDFIRAVVEKLCQVPDGMGVRIVRVYPETGDEDTVTCELEAPTREAFLCWLNAVNAKGPGRWVERVNPPQEPRAASRKVHAGVSKRGARHKALSAL